MEIKELKQKNKANQRIGNQDLGFVQIWTMQQEYLNYLGHLEQDNEFYEDQLHEQNAYEYFDDISRIETLCGLSLQQMIPHKLDTKTKNKFLVLSSGFIRSHYKPQIPKMIVNIIVSFYPLF